jgi:H+-transporting ATPase
MFFCSDKTGTLTQNKLKLGEVFCVKGYTSDQVILNAGLASRQEDPDAIDQAIMNGLKDKKSYQEFKIKHFLPFDPVGKRTEALVSGPDGENFKVSKGALQVILEMSASAEEAKSGAEKAAEEFAKKGFRSLGIAKTDGEGEWHFIGILSLFDPPREDSRETIQKANKMGIQVKMVTGDQIAIAREIARQLGLGTDILDAGMFSATPHYETGKLAEQIEKADGFAQVFPEHKYHIVDVLQQRGHIVGMTGDGVNDAPAGE